MLCQHWRSALIALFFFFELSGVVFSASFVIMKGNWLLLLLQMSYAHNSRV